MSERELTLEPGLLIPADVRMVATETNLKHDVEIALCMVEAGDIERPSSVALDPTAPLA